MSDGCDVVICTYNRPQLTLRAVQSVIDQSFSKWRLWIIDDASDFDQAQRLQKSVEKINDSRITYHFLSKNRGPANARNVGAHLGQMPYLAFLDSDDCWQPQKLERQIAFLQENQKFGYVHCDEKWIKNGIEIFPKKIHQKQGGFFFEKSLKLCLISPSAIMFRRIFWQNLAEHFNPAFFVAEDYEFWLRLNFFYPAGYLNEKLVVKYAGDWPQLSSRIEIDRQRVLALHRFYRRFHHHDHFKKYKNQFFQETFRKIDILIKGAQKYNRQTRIRQYQAWHKVWQRLEARDSFSNDL